MNRQEAVELAARLVEHFGNTGDLNNRGYKVDGWKPMTGPERADAIVKLAEFLVGPPAPAPDLPVDGRTTIYGWPTDGSAGPPSAELYRLAKDVFASMKTLRRPVLAAEVSALRELVEQYEATLPQPEPPPLMPPSLPRQPDTSS